MGLVLTDIYKSYTQMGQQIKVLKGLSADIKNSEIVAVIGQSGSGKSTLLSLLAGLDSVDSGSIVIDKTDITQLTQPQMTAFRASNIGFVFQQFHLMSHLTALENVMLPLEILGHKDPRDESVALLEKVGLSHRLNHLPSLMSGGECQRVAIARALVVQPKILLADEPSGNLDIETGHMVMSEFFRQVREHKVTTLVVTHSEVVASMCDRRLHLQEGRLV
jgi:putative ABC transport system ATP-binding protein